MAERVGLIIVRFSNLLWRCATQFKIVSGAWLEYEKELLGKASPDLEVRIWKKRSHAIKHDRLEAIREEFARLKQKIF